jgi:two-component system, OmpR family, alkaline phosphatase synthesis response regulator PhoP
MLKRILIIEDDKDIVEALRYNLEKDKKFSVLSALTGDAGMVLALETHPHLIILDIGLPGLNGFEVCRELRREKQTQSIPILILTARSSEADKVMGLELGADDYMTKPFGIRELIARVRAVLRRKEMESGQAQYYEDENLYMNFEDHVLRIQGKDLPLTVKEFNLLRLLIQNSGRVMTREKILDSVWGYNYYGESRTVDVHIRRIRKKMGAWAENHITTIIGVGYRFDAPLPSSTPPGTDSQTLPTNS